MALIHNGKSAVASICAIEEVSAQAVNTRDTMALTPNRPLCCIHSCTLSVGNRHWLYRLTLNWFNLSYNLLYSLLVVQQIDKKSKQWSLSHTVRVMHVCRRPVAARDAVNTRRQLSQLPVYITLTYRQCAVAKFSKSRVWDGVPEGSTLILEIP